MTQKDVAKRADLSFSYVSTLERTQPHSLTGNEIVPSRDKVIAIAKAVGGDVDEALELNGYAPAKTNSFIDIGLKAQIKLGASDLSPEEQQEIAEEMSLAYAVIMARREARKKK